MNEEKLIEWIKKTSRTLSDVTLGIGDDAASIKSPSKFKELLFAADMLIENVHFKSEKFSKPQDWGYKAAMCNISDIASMGGAPKHLLVSLGFPKSFSLAKAKKVYRGIQKAAKCFDVDIIGGDVVSSQQVVISVSIVGLVGRAGKVTRSGARIGDIVFVTGPLGGAVTSGRHLSFMPRIKESRFLVENFKVNAMMDISDGLSKDLTSLASSSGVGIKVFEDSIPLSDNVNSVENAFCDGEDFELLFCLAPKEASRLLNDRRTHRNKFTWYPIGSVTKEVKKITLVKLNGKEVSIPKSASHHFK